MPKAPLVQVTIVGPPEDADTAAMVAAARAPLTLSRALAVVNSDAARLRLAAEVPFAGQANGTVDQACAWVCIIRSCHDPVTSAEALQAVLDGVAVKETAAAT